MRIFVRLFLSRLHLSTDAEERVTMVQTFFSLSLEENGIDTNDRAVILAQLLHLRLMGWLRMMQLRQICLNCLRGSHNACATELSACSKRSSRSPRAIRTSASATGCSPPSGLTLMFAVVTPMRQTRSHGVY